MSRTLAFSLRYVCIFVLLAVSLAACGTSAPTTPDAPTAPVATDIPTEQPAEPTVEPTAEVEADTNAIASLDAVQRGVIRIEAQGSFVDPADGLQRSFAGSGSGFIINEAGIAVTNNHVVTGAALLKVYVDGQSKPLNARVLGASECSDLAVIDIDGDGFPYLQWRTDDIKVGLDVYTAGFPLGDPEFTLTRGIISKASADGETNWASVDSVIEHDATINPGNSGGPLVDGSGMVVGINYAGASSTNQYFAIAQAEASRILEQLEAGNDVTSIGVNGQAVYSEDLSGIWVASVKSGSPADKAGVKAGDIITSLENLPMAADGTMADYCDVLRSHSPEDTMAIEVLRYETEEVLTGQLNGRELEQSFSFAQTVESEVAVGEGVSYTEYRSVSDDTGALSMEVPAEWADVNGSAWVVDDAEIGVAIGAAPDLDDYNNTWGTPGVFFGASRSLAQNYNEESLLDLIDLSSACTLDGRYDYSDALYSGKYDLWTGCDGTDTAFLTLSVVPENRAFVALVQVQVVTEADLEALDRILATFVVTGDIN